MPAEVYQTPDVNEYARLKPYERARVRHILDLNAKLLAEQAETLEEAIIGVRKSRAAEIARAKFEARQAAKDEIARIFADEFNRERVRAFELYRPGLPSGDLVACADESYEYDVRNRATA